MKADWRTVLPARHYGWTISAAHPYKEYQVWIDKTGDWVAYKLDTVNKYPIGANPYMASFATCEEAMHWCETMEAVGA